MNEDSSTPLTAEKMAMHMFCNIPMNKLPPLATQYCQYLCSKYGGCGEVMLTAYAHYAQAIEGLECTDPAYAIDAEGQKFFQEVQM